MTDALYQGITVKIKNAGRKNTRIILPSGQEDLVPNEELTEVSSEEISEETKAELPNETPQSEITTELPAQSDPVVETHPTQGTVSESPNEEAVENPSESVPEIPTESVPNEVSVKQFQEVVVNKQPEMISKRLAHLVAMRPVTMPEQTAKVRPR